MKTKIFEIESNMSPIQGLYQLSEIARLLMDGEVVVFPTETVYGLGANAYDAKAVEKIFEAKGRPSDNPLIVHICSRRMLGDLVTEIPEKAVKLMDAFWPGPLTLIMKKSDKVPDTVSAGLSTVGVRFPSNLVAQGLIRTAGVPIAAPSANISGRPSPTQRSHVLEDMKGRVAAIIVSEDAEVGVESTVVDVTQEIPVVLRPGGITVEAIKGVVGAVEVSPNVIKNILPEKVLSPGMKYTHYAPKGELFIVKGSAEEKMKKINALIKNENKMKVGILATDETMGNYSAGIILSLGSGDDPEEMSRNLFARLRSFDDIGIEKIFAEDIELTNDTLAVVNRLYKAGGYRFV